MKRVHSVVLLFLAVVLTSSVSFGLSACGTLSTSDVLTQNVSATDTCITIDADNVVLDCQGYTITFGTGGSGSDNGVLVSSASNVTIQNCNIVTGNASATFNTAIYFLTSPNGTAVNNSVRVEGSSNVYAMRTVTGSDGVRFINNSIYANATPGFTTQGFNLADDDVFISGNYVELEGQDEVVGFSISGDRATIMDTLINVTDGGTGSLGIDTSGTDLRVSNTDIFATGSSLSLSAFRLREVRANVSDVVVYIAASGGAGTGIAATSLGDNGTFENINITIDAAGASRGIDSNSASDGRYSNVDITLSGGSDAEGILVRSSSYENVFANVTINTTGAATNDGIRIITGASNNTFRDITFEEYEGFAISIAANSFGNQFEPTNESVSLTSANLAFDLGTTQVRWTDSLTGSFSNLAQHLSGNATHLRLNSSAIPLLNSSAEVTVGNFALIDPVISVDYEDDGTFELCPGSVCSVVSLVDQTLHYTVTHFTTFRVAGTVPPVPEFSDFALIALLTAIIGGFFHIRKR